MRNTVLLVTLLALSAARTTAFLQYVPNTFQSAHALMRTAFLSAYGWKLLSSKSDMARQFFVGLDEVKICLTGDTVVLPDITWTQAVKARIVPGFASKLQQAREEAMMLQRSGWGGCVIGTVRSAVAGYIVFTDALGRVVVPMSVTGMMGGDKSIAPGDGDSPASTPQRIKRGLSYSRKLLGWK